MTGLPRHRSRPFEGPFRHRMCGLDGVYLVGGVTLHEDDGYGEGVSIADCDGLHHAILAWVASVRRPLLGVEARWVRRHLEFSAAEWAGLLGLTERDLAVMEDDRAKAVAGPVARLARLVALDRLATADDVTRDLERMAHAVRAPGPDRVAVFEHRDGAWRLTHTGCRPPFQPVA